MNWQLDNMKQKKLLNVTAAELHAELTAISSYCDNELTDEEHAQQIAKRLEKLEHRLLAVGEHP